MSYERRLEEERVKKETLNAKAANYSRKLHADARAIDPKRKMNTRPDTPSVIEHRRKTREWAKNNKDKVLENHKRFVTKSKNKVAEAIAQAEATQRNVDAVLEAALYESING